MTVSNLSSELVELRERVRDFIYDCTKDEFNTGWTLSAHQADDLIAMVSEASGISSLLERNERLSKWLEGESFDPSTSPETHRSEEYGEGWFAGYAKAIELTRAALETQDRGSASHDD